MRSETGRGAVFDAAAAAAGGLAGMVALVLLGSVLALILYRYPFSSRATDWAVHGTRIVAYLVAGTWAGRRAGDGGLVHGASAGLLQLAFAVLIALVAREGWPALRVLAPQVALALGAGAVGGILGVNL